MGDYIVPIGDIKRPVCNISGGEIDLDTVRQMDTADITHQHVVNEDPHVVIAGELELHVRTRSDLAVLRLLEFCGNGHTEVVVKRLSGMSLSFKKIVIL